MRQLPPLLDQTRSRLLLGLLGVGLTQACVLVVSALCLRAMIDTMTSATAGQNTPIAILVSVLLSCTLARSLLVWRERVLAEKLGQNYVFELRLKVFSHLSKLSLRTLSGTRKGTLITRFVSDLSALKNWISIGVAQACVSTLSIIVCVIALVVIQFNIGISVAITVAIGMTAMFYSGRRLDPLIRNTRKRRGYLASNVTEKLQGMATIQAFGQQARERKRLKKQATRLVDAIEQSTSLSALVRAYAQGLAGFAIVIAVSVGAWCVSTQTATAGDVVAALSIVSMLAPNFALLGRLYPLARTAKIAAERTQVLLNKGPTIRTSRKSGAFIGEGTLRFHRVSVEGSLATFSGTAKPGDHIVLTGANGTGKSTLLQLAMRLIEPDSGKITLDGVPLKDVSLQQLRKLVTLVSADLPIFRGTIASNLTYGRPNVDHSTLKRVADTCQIDLVSEDSPFYAARKIEENGRNLSRGQRMRIYLARALIIEPKILLVDEAEAGLDVQNMRLLKSILTNYPGTVILASHRRAMINSASKQWRLKPRSDHTLAPIPHPVTKALPSLKLVSSNQ